LKSKNSDAKSMALGGFFSKNQKTIKTKTMEDNIKDALESEFTNAGELMGIDDAMSGELTDYLGKLNPIHRAVAIRKLSTKPVGSRGSRAEFEKFFKELPAEVKSGLLKGNLRLTDYTIYSMKPINNSKTIKLFETQDVKETGLRNIDKAKLDKNFVFLVSGIYFFAGVSADITDNDKLKATNFQSVVNFPAIANGEFSLKANKKQIIPEGNMVRKFITDNDHTRPLGYFKLDNPRLIKDDELIEFVVELGTTLGLDPNTVLYVGLDGTGTTP
jgi:hypothetical protein